ncbi:MAG: tRNA (adenosine(37)-N6)-threonylcarbamoyltransferase complex ATPase subunit type 1 TsaE [Defluviitaleaceae bacterium]|nr:tRNA (adenosine(37)-N6)-threonylcarbamoyltransferase complex ATPase subunit type 1 TsaE [Defluviitaleaceae bacterium]
MIMISRSAEETEKIAFEFGQRARAGDIFCLSGELGAGKTVFVKGFARGVGYEGCVTSPTFTIMNEYEGGRLPIYHFDLYRLEGACDLENIGYEEFFFGCGVSLVEWPERANEIGAGSVTTRIDFSHTEKNENYRVICFENFSN